MLIDSFVACASASSPGPNPTAVISFSMSCFVTVAPDIPFGFGFVPSTAKVCFEISSTIELSMATAVGAWSEMILKSNLAAGFWDATPLIMLLISVMILSAESPGK